MKKWIALLLAAVLCLSLAACGKASELSAEPTESAYADVEACAGYAIEKLKTVLKNPASLQVNSLSAWRPMTATSMPLTTPPKTASAA